MIRPLSLTVILAFTLLAGGCRDAATPPTPAVATDTPAAVSAPPAEVPTTYGGTWAGEPEPKLHVREIVFETDEFPCAGKVATQYGRGQVFDFPVRWEREGDSVVGLFADPATREVIARVRLAEGTLSGDVNLPVVIANQPKDLKVAGFTKRPAGGKGK